MADETRDGTMYSINLTGGWAAAVYAGKNEWVLVSSGKLAPSHWANQNASARNLANMEITARFPRTTESTFSGFFVNASVVPVDSYQLEHDGNILTVEDHCLAFGTDEWSDCTLVIPVKAGNPGYVLGMASSYISNDEYQDNDFEEDSTSLNNLVAELRGRSPAETLNGIIVRGKCTEATNLDGASIGVRFEGSGYQSKFITFDLQPLLVAVQAVCSDASPDTLNLLKEEFAKVPAAKS